MYIDQYHVPSILYSYTFIAIAAFYLLGNQIMLWLNRQNVSVWSLIKTGMTISIIGVVFMVLGIFFNVPWIILGLITWGVVLLRMATAFINPPIQVVVTHYFGKNGAQALGLLSCLQYIAASVGIAVASSMPWHPSTNLVVSSILFGTVGVLGYVFCPRRELS